jgi:chemotaxis-related protein WspB
MLSVIFPVGSARYALDLPSVIRILPLASLTPLPAAAPEIAGLLNFHGSVIPVIDLNYLVSGAQCPAVIGTRIVLVRRPATGGRAEIFGLRVPCVDVQVIDPALAFLPNDLPLPAWLDRILVCGGDLVHAIRPDVLVAQYPALSALAVRPSIAETERDHGDSPAN